MAALQDSFTDLSNSLVWFKSNNNLVFFLKIIDQNLGHHHKVKPKSNILKLHRILKINRSIIKMKMKNLRRKNRLQNNNHFKQIIYQIKHLILKKTIINNKRNKHRMIHFINYLFRLVFLCKINCPSLNPLNSLFCFNVEC